MSATKLVYSPIKGPLPMVSRYLHADRRASSSCALCRKSIYPECSNWTVEDLCVCLQCWRGDAAGEPTIVKWQKKPNIAAPRFRARASAVQYHVALALVVVGC